MTSTTFSFDSVGGFAPATHTPSVAARDRKARTARVFSGAVLAAAVAALMVIAALVVDRSDAGSELVTAGSLWVIAFLALIACARVTSRFSRQLLKGWLVLHERWVFARGQAALREAVRDDPRMLRELQIIRDRAEWVNRS